MVLKKFKARNFRNIEGCEIEFSDGINLLYGNNAQGKTNAIEGIYLFARGKSFRSSEDRELVRFGSDGFSISIDYETKNGKESLEYNLFGKERRRRKNGYKIDKVKEMIGSFKAVLFCPEDLNLVKEGPENRRAFLNVAIGQCYDVYINYYANYKKALENRNCLLKLSQKGMYVDENELLSWSDYMANYASYIYIMRMEYIKKLGVYAKEIMKDISYGKEELTLYYKSDIERDIEKRDEAYREYRRVFTENLEKEKLAGITLYGIHRDDIGIDINGTEARKYASQGQQRSIVLSLKLSEGELNRDICGEYPVFLFDDVLSELDENRKKYIVNGIKKRQIIISSCEKDDGGLVPDKVIEVFSGEYKER